MRWCARARGILGAAGILLILGPPAVRAEPVFVLPELPNEPVVVRGLGELDLTDQALGQAVRVFVVPSESTEVLPAMLGVVTIVDDGLSFAPRFSFVPGLRYRVELAWEGVVTSQEFLLSQPDTPSPQVIRVDPGADPVPMNLLRFYLTFSQPMQEGQVVESVFLEKNGVRLEDAFVETVPELWDPSQRRLTMILHPGRIKRGLDLHERLGPVFSAGDTITLVVASSMTSTAGIPLEERFEHRFTVGAEDRHSADPRSWGIETPPSGTRQPLSIRLDEPLDHAMLPRHLAVRTKGGADVQGTITVLPGDASCLFEPSEAWTAGEYVLMVHPDLEDRAGNRIDMLFDRQRTPSSNERRPVELEFTVKRGDQ